MRYFVLSFASELKKQLSSLRTWIMILILPLLTLGFVALIPQEDLQAPVTVGVVLPESGAADFKESLSEHDGIVVDFRYTSEEELEKNVALGLWDCGFVLPEDFNERIDAQDTNKLIKIVISDNSVCYYVVRETISACIADITKSHTAADYISSFVPAQYADRDAIKSLIDDELGNMPKVGVNLSTVDGSVLTTGIIIHNLSVRAAILIALLVIPVWLIFMLIDLSQYLRRDYAKRLSPVKSKAAQSVPFITAGLLPVALSVLFTVIELYSLIC